MPAPDDPEIVSYLLGVLDEHGRADNMIGPKYVISAVLPQIRYLRDLLRTARGPVRAELLRVAARYHECCGWLFQDAGQLDKAMYWTDRALEYAHQLGDPRQMSYVLMRKSNIATDADDPYLALGLADAALRASDSLTQQLRAVSLRQRANAYALLGDRDHCARAIDAALAEVANAIPEPGELAPYCTVPYVEMEAATCWVRLDQPSTAIDIYQRGLSDWPAGLRRDRGLCLSRLARAHATVGDVTQACAVATEAVAIASKTRSARTLTELRAVRAELQPWRKIDIVTELTASLATLTRAA